MDLHIYVYVGPCFQLSAGGSKGGGSVWGGGGGGWERAEQITQTQLQTRVIQVSVVVCRHVCYVNRAILLPFVLG